MRSFEQIPLWAAIIIAALLVIGPTLALIGNLGLLRLRRFYERLHAPTLGTSWGTASVILASMLMFTILEGRPVLHELVIGIFVMITTPVTLLLLGRAALRRDRSRASPELDERAQMRTGGSPDNGETTGAP